MSVLLVCIYMCSGCLVFQRPKEDTRPPGTGVRHDCELPSGCWKLHPGSLKEQQSAPHHRDFSPAPAQSSQGAQLRCLLAGRVLSGTGHRAQAQGTCMCVSFDFSYPSYIKSPGFSLGEYSLSTLSNPSHFPNAPSLNTIAYLTCECLKGMFTSYLDHNNILVKYFSGKDRALEAPRALDVHSVLPTAAITVIAVSVISTPVLEFHRVVSTYA